MSKKIGCGGFRIDDDTLKLKEDGTLYAAGGGGGSIPKPLTYDYMPEGYPSKGIGTVTLMEEQKVSPFTDAGEGLMSATSPVVLELADGDKLTVVWDGVSYDTVVTMIQGQYPVFGNLELVGAGEVADYPFAYLDAGGPMWATADTAASHTIKVTATKMVYNTIDVNMLPKAGEGYGVVKKDEIVTAYVFPNNLAPQIEMNKAIDDFIAGKASISWKRFKIIYAERPSDTEIHIALSDNPTRYVKCVASDNHGVSCYNWNLRKTIKSESSMSSIQLYDYDNPSIGSIAIRASIDSNNSANDHVSFNLATRIYNDGIAIKSSSGKLFKITVDDSGTIKATEVT